MSASVPYIRSRLSVMMFLEFMLWASWYVPIGGYMNSELGFAGWQIGLIMATTAIGAILSPMFVGYVADRLFATERILSVLHFLGGICLLLSSQARTFPALFTLLLINALCFMPTMALCNSLSFRNIDDPNRFSRIAVWGTIGWICSGWAVDILLGGAGRGLFFYLAGGGAIAMGFYCLTLPHTPPKGAESGGDVMGLGALKLFADPAFLVFALCAFLISIPLSFYFVWGHAFLTETERPVPTLLMTLSQFSEIVVMLIMPWFIGRYGLKTVLVVGMSAWAARYALFATGSFPLVVLGLLVHGFCYCFVFVAAFIYVNKKAPPEIGASAQSLIGLLMWGVGMLVGTQVAGWAGGHYAPPTIAAEQQIMLPEKRQEKLAEAALPKWPPVNEATQTREATLTGQAGETSANQPMLLDAGQAVVIGPLKVRGEVGKEGLVDVKKKDDEVISKTTYPRTDLLAAFKKADVNQDNLLTHQEWQEYRMHNWPPIWLWPGLLAAIVAIFFGFGGRDATEAAVSSEPAPKQEPPAPAPPRVSEPKPAAPEKSLPPIETIPLDDGPIPPTTPSPAEPPPSAPTEPPADQPPPAAQA